MIRWFVYERWIAGTKSLRAQYNEYHSIMNKFYSSSLTQGTYGVKFGMHKLIKVVAVKEVDQIMVQAYMNLTETPEDDRWKEDLQKAFFIGTNQIAKRG